MSNERFHIHDLSVCVVCIHLIANGEFNDGTDAAEICSAGQEKEWGENAIHLTPGSEEFGFSTSWCEGCGDTLHGDRFEAFCMIPKT